MTRDRREHDSEEEHPGTIEVPSFLKHPLAEPGRPDVVGELSTPLSGSVIDEPPAMRQPEERSDVTGLYLYGIVRARTWRALHLSGRELQRVRYRDIEALVRSTAFQLPGSETQAVHEHQQLVERVMRRSTILPAPYGIIFKGRRPLIRMLQNQYLVLDEGLSLLDGHWELRLHVSTQAVGAEEEDLSDVAMTIYSELRRFARAAVTTPAEQQRVLTAAFLVDRTTWVEFVERVEDFGTNYPALTFDVTGPWPAYDFIRILV